LTSYCVEYLAIVRIHNATFVDIVRDQCFLPTYLTLWNCKRWCKFVNLVRGFGIP